jgi:hypothetical protein
VENQVFLRDRDGTARGLFAADGPVAALALGALSDYAVLALAEGKLLALTP